MSKMSDMTLEAGGLADGLAGRQTARRLLLISISVFSLIAIAAVGYRSSDSGIDLESSQPLPFHLAALPLDEEAYPANLPALRITELNLGKEIWAELYCARGMVDLAAYSLSDLDGTDRPLVENSATLSLGQYAVVHWGDGVDETDNLGDLNRNGFRDIYIGARSQNDGPSDDAPSRNVDQLALIAREPGRNTVIDAVAWSVPGKAPERWELDDMKHLARVEMWEGETLEITSIEGASWTLRDLKSPGSTFERWALAPVATPGMSTDQANIPALGSLSLTEVHAKAGPSEAFAEIRCAPNAPRSGVNLRAFKLSNLDGEASTLATSDLILKPGEYAVVHWSNEGITEYGSDRNAFDRNGNGIREIFLPANEAPASTEDLLALTLGGQVYDAIGWKRPNLPVGKNLAADLEELSARGVASPLFDLSGPEALIARAEGDWFVSTVPSPGSASRLVRPLAKGTVILSEVYPDGARSWIEIANSGKSAEAVDVSLFVISDLDGRGEAIAREPLTLGKGERLLVRWGEGLDEIDVLGDANGNGIREAYLETSRPPSSTIDQAVLSFGVELHDALAWKTAGAKESEAEAKDLDRLKSEFKNFTVAERPERGSIARVEGKICGLFDPTPGLPNDHYLRRPFGGVRLVAFKVTSEEAWAEVECTKGPTDISRLIVSDLDDQDLPLSEESIVLAKGERIRIVWGKSDAKEKSNLVLRTILLDQDKPTKSGDQIVLIHDGKVLDAVSFADWDGANIPYPERDDVKKLGKLGGWPYNGEVPLDPVVTFGKSVRRVGAKWEAEGA